MLATAIDEFDNGKGHWIEELWTYSRFFGFREKLAPPF